MVIKAELWDKTSPINGKEPDFLTKHFQKQNGNANRILISYDGVVSRIQYLDDMFFTTENKVYKQSLIDRGFSTEQAMVETWEAKAQSEYAEGEHQNSLEKKIEQLRADVDLILNIEQKIENVSAITEEKV